MDQQITYRGFFKGGFQGQSDHKTWHFFEKQKSKIIFNFFPLSIRLKNANCLSVFFFIRTNRSKNMNFLKIFYKDQKTAKLTFFKDFFEWPADRKTFIFKELFTRTNGHQNSDFFTKLLSKEKKSTKLGFKKNSMEPTD